MSETGAARDFKAQIHQIEQTPSGVMILSLHIIDEFDHLHQPGQYLQLRLGDEWSFFSIASVPCTKSPIELHIQTKDQQKIDFLLDAFAQKIFIDIRYAFGLVRWPTTYSSGIFLCRGTGFAPAKALIEAALSRNPDRVIHLLWEADSLHELYFERWLLVTLKTYPHFTASIYSKDNQPQHQNTDRLAYDVGSILNQHQFEKARVQQTWFYLCASPVRVYQWSDKLATLGVNASQLSSDVFEYAPKPSAP